jgi:hypothetical protein
METFDINSKVEVLLKELCFFDPWDGRREVPLLPKENMVEELARKFNLGTLTDSQIKEKFRDEGILSVKSFTGLYVGGRPGLAKIKPYYGIEDPESEYFIVSDKQIDLIYELF